jgi:hypothetical protein
VVGDVEAKCNRTCGCSTPFVLASVCLGPWGLGWAARWGVQASVVSWGWWLR